MRHRTRANVAALAGCLLASVVTAGCLEKQTTSTLCLDPDGSVRWSVLDRNIHATGDSPAARQQEEDQFMTQVAAEQHSTAVAFRALEGSHVRTQVVSAAWPFAVLTEARFPDIGHLWQRYFDALGMRAASTLTRADDRTTWTLEVEVDPDSPPDRSEIDQAVGSLIDDDAPLIVCIRRGRFVASTGFVVTDDDRVATMEDLDKRDWEKNPRLVLSLTWTPTEAAAPARTANR